MRRIQSALLAVVMAGALLPVAAVAPVVAYGEVGCLDDTGGTYHAGKAGAVPSAGINAVRAQFSPTNSVMPGTCTSAVDLHSFTSYWVAVQPFSNRGRDIVQVGMMKCKANGVWYPFYSPTPCDPDKTHTWRYFYAYGGCNGNTPWARDIGPASVGTHVFAILWNGTNITIQVDGTTKATISTSQMSCWNGDHFGDVWPITSVETEDRGDGAGGSSASRLRAWTSTRNLSNVWEQNLYYTTTCQSAYTPYKCHVPNGSGGNELQFYTLR